MSSVDITKGLVTEGLLQALGPEVTKYMLKTCKDMDTFAKTGKGLNHRLEHIYETFDRSNPFPEIYGLFYELDVLKLKNFRRWVKQ